MNNQRHIALIILLTPLIVLSLSTALFYSGIFSTTNTTENGSFLNPHIETEGTELSLEDGTSFEFIKGKWYLVYFDDFNDLELSSEKYQTARAINITLGREMNRLKRVVVYRDKEKFESIEDVRADYSDIVFVYDGEFLFERRIETQRDNPYQSKSFFILNFYSDVVGEFYDTLTFSEIFEDVKKLL